MTRTFLFGHDQAAKFRWLVGLAIVALAWTAAMPALAASPADNAIDWFRLSMGLFGGLALFLFGMEQMSDGLKAAAGEGLKMVLSKLTTNRFTGALTGAFVTAVLNSSSVTTVLVVGFITAGLMSLAQSVGIIMGANIGSTVTAQIVAFNVTQYALLPVTVGFVMIFSAKQEKTKYYGMMLMGLGLVFYGMGVMSQSMNPLRSYQPFLDLMVRMENPLLGILVGAVFTGLVQSSAATTGIAIVMASEGLMSLPAGIALAFGANIGTCVTALLAAIGKPPEAVRAAAAHIVFNVAGVLLWVAFIPYLAQFVEWLSPAYDNLEEGARRAAEVPRQIANAHTVFNVANTLIFIGFTTQIARLVEWMVPDRAPKEGIIIEPKYLDEALLETPSLALQQVRFELGRQGDIVCSMLRDLGPAMHDRDQDKLEDIAKQDDKVDILNDTIMAYMTQVRQEFLTETESETFQALMGAAVNLENLADIIETDLVKLGEQAIAGNLTVVEGTEQLLVDLHEQICTAVEQTVKAVRDNDQQAAQEVVTMKDPVRHLVNQLLQAQTRHAGDAQQILHIQLQMEFVDKLRYIYTLAKRVAKDILPKELSGKA